MNVLSASGPPEIAWPAIAAVLLITAAATAVHWWLRQRGLIPAAASNPIKLVATRSLGGKRSVAIVEVGDQRLLLGMTDESVTLLSPLAGEAKAIGIGSVAPRPTAVNG